MREWVRELVNRHTLQGIGLDQKGYEEYRSRYADALKMVVGQEREMDEREFEDMVDTVLAVSTIAQAKLYYKPIPTRQQREHAQPSKKHTPHRSVLALK